MLMDECIDPDMRKDYNRWRKLAVLQFRKTDLPDVGNFTMQYYGNNLLEVIEDMCAVGGIGYKVEFTGSGFVFSLYVGVDRTVGQSDNERVIFSEDFENLGQCTYTYDNTNYCNAVMATGATNGTTKISMYWFNREECVDQKELCYNHRWRKVRAAYLRRHPLCVKCLAEGRYVTATVVDHIVPHRGNPLLMWDVSNYQALCKPCHDRKTGTEDSRPEYTY